MYRQARRRYAGRASSSQRGRSALMPAYLLQGPVNLACVLVPMVSLPSELSP